MKRRNEVGRIKLSMNGLEKGSANDFASYPFAFLFWRRLHLAWL
jgi:hypothetical protein